jgi:hypothetical protein
MNKLLVVAVLGFMVSPLLPAQTASIGPQENAATSTGSSADLQEQIKQLERDRQDAFVRNDIVTLDQRTADDYTTINSSGKISDKAQMMSNLRAGKTKVQSVKLDEMKVRVYGNTAVLTGRYQDTSVKDGIQKEAHALFMRIFVKDNGHWQAVAYQQTSISVP